jgi:hypothetical protein
MRIEPFLAALLISVALAGCASEPERPPILVIDEVRYWFEDDLLVFNITLHNQANFTPGPPLTPRTTISLKLSMDQAKPRPGTRPGQDLVPGGNWSTLTLAFAPSQEEPLMNRYYEDEAARRFSKSTGDGDYGPFSFTPGKVVQFEFAFLPSHFANKEGYYTLTIRPMASYLDASPDMHFLQTGCFNHDTPEFYGVRADGPDCDFYDSSGEWTENGMPKYGVENTGDPVMIHDPPSGIPDAH